LNWGVFGSCRNTGLDEKRGQITFEVHMVLPHSHFKISIASYSAKEHKRTCSHVHKGYDKHEGLWLVCNSLWGIEGVYQNLEEQDS
jgi:hypothetical protein